MNNPKITVITVCYNAINEIEDTINSVINQSYDNIEYIVIDGASDDGTIDIIMRYKELISQWVSEPDKGIYDAMNKGIRMATGDWIGFLNAGDNYSDRETIQSVIPYLYDCDVVYGNSIEFGKGYKKIKHASADVLGMDFRPIYRHGSSFVKSEVHKENLFDLTKTNLSYALDWELIHRLYLKGFKFKKIDVVLESYQIEGISNHQLLNRWYNYKITSNGKFDIKRFALFIGGCLKYMMNKKLLLI